MKVGVENGMGRKLGSDDITSSRRTEKRRKKTRYRKEVRSTSTTGDRRNLGKGWGVDEGTIQSPERDSTRVFETRNVEEGT